MNIFFDVDFTLISWNYRLRPHVRTVFEWLRADGHTIYIWSGMGMRWEIVREHQLHDLVADCFAKPLYDHIARLDELGIAVYPDYVIDDHAEVVEVFGGYHIPPPLTPLEQDQEMLRVYDAIAVFAAARSGAVPPVATDRPEAE